MTLDLSGQRFGRLVAIKRLPSIQPGRTRWSCRCDCGNEPIVQVDTLVRGKTRSCGCLLREYRELLVSRYFKHGHHGTVEYNTWKGMISRCENSNEANFSKYGGRGIQVCERWRNSFENFYADMGPRPSNQHSIDRINNDGNYEPGNCRWTTRDIQQLNKSTNRRVTAFGRTQTLTEWSRETGINKATLTARIDYHGWPVEKALSTPVRTKSGF